MSSSLRPHESQQARPPCPSPTPGVYPNSCPSSRWCHPAISSSVVPFSCPQSRPASGSFLVNQLFAWGGQSIGVSASASLLPINTYFYIVNIKVYFYTLARGALSLSDPSDVYVRSFLCPFLYFNKTLLYKNSWVIKPGPWSRSKSSLEVTNLTLFSISYQC